MQIRLEKVREMLQEQDIDMCFIQTKENVFYLTNFYTDPHERLMGLFLFKHNEPMFVCPKMEINQMKAAGWSYDIIGYSDHENPWDLIDDSLQKHNVKSFKNIAVEKEEISYSRVESIQKLVQGAEIVPAEEMLNSFRVIKDDNEIKVLREAAKLADYGVQVGIEALKEGITEMEVLAKIEFELKKKGIREMSFSTMVLFGDKSGDPHGNPGLKKLTEGDFVLFDLGVVLDGYCSDITRTFVYKSYNEKQKEIYETVLQAQQASIESSKPGVRIGDLDVIARKVITDAGYGEYFPHRLGHGLGINVHEFPSMSHINNDVLKEGMVYTIEPGIYLPSIGGVRIEDDILITKNGHEILTKTNKEFTVVS
ncbi:Xaa-Pro dipeptidase [Metabacillus crassostreae]|uniref:M24 family metallopeptidase n=1 Tax=Metabacillus crassostreae TaxID=929098 RepID=UPI00195DCDF3|nr:Xaa-Pro peptidase family protein [Metabacillus crassostreae]MBM7603626.1 Xaa-Pro dipeptidase [Metabacillus crassostreae]